MTEQSARMREDLLADVARAGGAKDGVGQRVRDRVGIRVAGQALGMGNGDAAQDEGAARDEAVGVVTDPHARHAATGSSMTV